MIMTNKRTLPALALCLWACAGTGMASTLNISVAGQFSSDVTGTQLVNPNGNWAISFDVNSVPQAMNADQLGFDAPFTGFSYKLDGVRVATGPESIRFSTIGGLGLFTLFFGPESGYDANGNAVPEFSLQGPQMFAGTTSSPTITGGSYAVTEWTYSDSVNYDDVTPTSSVVKVATATPEASSMWLMVFAGGAVLALRQGLIRLRKVS